MSKTLMIFGSIIVSVLIGIVFPKLSSQEVQGIEVDHSKLFAEVQTQFIEDLWEAHIIDLENKSVLPKGSNQNITLVEASETSSPVAPMRSVQVSNEEEIIIDHATEVPFGNSEEVVPVAEEVVVDEGEGNIQSVKDAWVQSQIDKNIDRIAREDLIAGAALYNLLDTEYLFQLAEDGLSDEDKLEAKTYLEMKLSPSEITTAMELYNKYVYLLNE